MEISENGSTLDMGECGENSQQLSVEKVRGFFNDPRTVDHYMKAVANVGLWKSERIVFEKWFPDRSARILDLGCGAGRIAFGLAGLGYDNVLGADLAEEMVIRAEQVARAMDRSIPFQREDATDLNFVNDSFDGIVFGFNGLMQIPSRKARVAALREIYRCLDNEGLFVFTTLDREDTFYERVFTRDDLYEHDVEKNPELIDYGDRLFATSHGTTYMHVPSQAEVRTDLENVGFLVAETKMRSSIAKESEAALKFAENCRFWVAEKK